jgi:hypothetical protein
MASKTVTITKIDESAPAVPTSPPEETITSVNVPTIKEYVPAVAAVAAVAASRTFPRGILRKTTRRKRATISATADPSRPPPKRVGAASRIATRRRLRLSTTRSAEDRHKSLHKSVEKLPLKTIRKKLIDKGIVRPERKVSPAILRTLYAESVGAGLLQE